MRPMHVWLVWILLLTQACGTVSATPQMPIQPSSASAAAIVLPTKPRIPTPSDAHVMATTTLAPPEDILPTATTVVKETMPTTVSEPPAGFKEYSDAMVGVSIFIPESWFVSSVIMGEYVIFQSYPENKYVGGEMLVPGDTKCDLNIRPAEVDIINYFQQLKSAPTITIVSESELVLQSGQPATKLEIDSMGRSTALMTEINERVIVFTCFGDMTLFDQIASTLAASHK